MEAGAAGSYDLAAAWLAQAARAYDAAGRIEDWIEVIDGLIDRHRRKYKLRPLLEGLGLPPERQCRAGSWLNLPSCRTGATAMSTGRPNRPGGPMLSKSLTCLSTRRSREAL